MSLQIDKLTRDQAHAALQAVEAALSPCIHCSLHKGEGASLPFEPEFSSALLTAWANATSKAERAALTKLFQKTGDLAADEVSSMLTVFDLTLNTHFVEATEVKLPPIFNKAYKAGKKVPFVKRRKSPIFTVVDETASNWLSKHHLYWIHGYYDKQLSQSLADAMAQGLQEGLGREAIGNKLKEFFEDYPGVGVKPAAYWEGLAANGMSRARNFGQVQGYVDLQVKELRILAVIDERTSDICREMNGRVIRTIDAVEQRERLMSATMPEEVKTAAPWFTPDQIRAKLGRPEGALPTQEIVGLGMTLPPYHFNCRTTVVETVTSHRTAT